MPKPTRRERRQLAEKGKLAPRRVIPDVVERTAPVESLGRANISTPKTIVSAQSEPALQSDTNEYAYVKSDLARIMLLAVTLVGVMVALKFVLPQ